MSKEYNFCYPLDLIQLENDRLKLVPFESNLPHHAELYTTLTAASPAALANFNYLPYGPFTTTAAFLDWYVPTIQSNNGVVWFAIFVKPAAAEGELDYAGNIGYLNGDANNASVELGHLNILPHHQRTFVNTHACGLLLNYALNPPSQSPSPSTPSVGTGLGLRRTQWFANAQNANSRRAAERLGFQFEGILRWHRVLPAHKVGRYGERDGDGQQQQQQQQEGQEGQGRGEQAQPQPQPKDGRGKARDSALLGLCWDDWLLEGGRERVRVLMER